MVKTYKKRSILSKLKIMRDAFTLIELLIVITIIMILAAILLPVLAQARYTAKTIVCINQLKEITLAWTTYAGDSDAYYPNFGDVNHPDAIAAVSADERTRWASPRFRPYDWSNYDSRYPYFNGDLRPLVSPILGNLDDIVHCPLSVPYFKKTFDFEGKDAAGNYIDKYPKASYWIYPDANYYRFEWRNPSSRRKAMRKIGQSFEPATTRSNLKGLRWDIVAADCVGWADPYGGRSLYGPVSSHPSRQGGSVENGSYSNFFWWDWNTPLNEPITGSFSRGDGSVTYYPVIRPYEVKLQWGSHPGWRIPISSRGSLLPMDLAVEE